VPNVVAVGQNGASTNNTTCGNEDSPTDSGKIQLKITLATVAALRCGQPARPLEYKVRHHGPSGHIALARSFQSGWITVRVTFFFLF